MKRKIKLLWQKVKPYIIPYAIAIAIPLTVGLISAALTKDNMQVYRSLKTPPLSPPAILFPIVWTLLYILMGISSAMVYLKREKNIDGAKSGLVYYGFSLFLNFSWSIVFFNLQAAFFALVNLVALLVLVLKTIREYRKVCHTASYLQIPYVIWLIFAAYLNTTIWLLN